jgi:hypothetical protein
VAARGAGAAAGDAGGRVCQWRAREESADDVAAFRQGVNEMSYIIGRNVALG